MEADVKTMATVLGTVLGAAGAAFKLGRRSANGGRQGGADGAAAVERRNGHAPYVRLTAVDSARIERLDALMERLIALEEHHQATTERLAALVVEARLEQATRHGEIIGLLRARG